MTNPNLTPLSPEHEQGIRDREQAATPGPWGSHRDLDGVYTVQARPRITPSEGNVTDGDIAFLAIDQSDTTAYANATFIAHAREDVSALLAELDQARTELNEMGASLRRAAGQLANAQAERDAFADRVDTLTAVAKGNKRHVKEMYLDLQKANAELAAARTLAARCPHGCSDCEDHEREVARTGADPTPGRCPACEDRRPGAQRGDR